MLASFYHSQRRGERLHLRRVVGLRIDAVERRGGPPISCGINPIKK